MLLVDSGYYNDLKIIIENSGEKMDVLVSCQFWESFAQQQVGKAKLCLVLEHSLVSLRRTIGQMEEDMVSSFADEQCLLFVEDEDELIMDDEQVVLWMLEYSTVE